MAVLNNVKVKWASVQQPNETYTPVWCLDAVLDETQAKELHAQGFTVKRDKDGDIILKIKKNVFRKDGNRNQPPKVVGPDKQPFLDLIGNGSVCNVQYNPFEWTYAGKSGVSASLVAIQVVKHESFGGGDEFDVVDNTPAGDSGGSTSLPAQNEPVDFDDDIPF